MQLIKNIMAVSAIAWASFKAPISLAAEGKSSVDTSVISGFALGSVTKLDSTGSKATFRVGGVPLGLTWNHDIAADWSSALGGALLFDIINKQMIRSGLTASLAYHLLGGARRIDRPGDALHITATSPYNFSLVGRAALLSYGASDPKAPGTNVAGSLWEIATGLELRRDLSEASAFGSSLLVTLTTLPASVERLSGRTTEVLIFWRRFW